MTPIERRKRASAEAATWWVRLQAEQPSLADRQEFVDWLRESAVHVAEMLRVAQIHGALEQFQRWAEIETDGSHSGEERVISLASAGVLTDEGDERAPAATARSPLQERHYPNRVHVSSGVIRGKPDLWKRRGPLAIAIALTFFAVSAAVLWPMYFGQSIRTERGERREVMLSDGSVVEMDHDTRLRVKFEQQARRVWLDEGRALFRVTKNPSRPFFVQTNRVTIRAVGTAFAVDRQLQRVIVTVAEGRVGVLTIVPPSHAGNPTARGGATGERAGDATTAERSGSGAQRSSRADDGEVFVATNQQVTVPASGSAQPVRDVDSRRELAWAEGRLVFDNNSVAEVIEEFNRYNRVQLHVADETLAVRPISGTFNATDPESFIAFLQGVSSVRVIRGGSESITLVPEEGSSAQNHDPVNRAPDRVR